MDDVYDFVFLGTGLTECILSSLLSLEGKKVLHIDKNSYYGDKITSLTPLKSLFDHFGISKDLDVYKRGKDWNVDLISKFIMSNGNFVSLLVHTGVLRYLDFKQIEGTYFCKSGCFWKVPSDEGEAFSSNLMSVFEKRRLRKFLTWAMNVNAEDVCTWNSVYTSPMDIKKDVISIAFSAFHLEEETQSFIGHAVCLYPDASYKDSVPAAEVIDRIQLYSKSVTRYGKSPYVYPLYGLGELPQAFSRLSAVHGGTYMLNKPVDEILFEDGKVVGLRSGEETVRCGAIVCSPTYAPDNVRKTGQVIRAICILNHPIEKLPNCLSAQIIIPSYECGRKHDIYVSYLSHTHMVCPEGFFLVLLATTVETDKPHDELKPGIDLLGAVEQVFYSVDDLWAPVDDGRNAKLFVSTSYDASTHFESTFNDVLSLYERITGESFDLEKVQQAIAKVKESLPKDG